MPSAILRTLLVAAALTPLAFAQTEPLTTLKVTTREVIVDAVAADQHDLPVTDLKAEDLAVFELAPKSSNKPDKTRTPQRITSVRYIAPLSEPPPVIAAGSLHVRLGSGCAEATTGHYEITYHVSPTEIHDGDHRLLITVSRPGITLHSGSRYFVAGTERLAQPEPKPEAEQARLIKAACFHSDDPLSLPLLVDLLPSATNLRYRLTIPPPALPLVSLTAEDHTLQLEYAACSFDPSGRPVNFMHTAATRTLSPADYTQTTLHGLHTTMELPESGRPAAIRFIVRDRLTGNMGALLVETPASLKAGDLTPPELAALQQHHLGRSDDDDYNPPPGPIGSFGTIEPRAGALCGAVYELPAGTPSLPNFWTLESIGSLYAYLLDVPHQNFSATGGLPGITRATEWFGIDYHGAFTIKTAGTYDFRLVADDGAKLYLDDHLLIDADSIHNVRSAHATIKLATGRHTLHLPYFQGPPTAVALQLLVKPPGGTFQLFDMRDYSDTFVSKP